MGYVRVKSYAKINLTLDIVGAQDGYHMLDSVVASIDIYDLITAKSRRDGLVNVTMHGMGSESIPQESNNAYIAAERFVSHFKTCGADIDVYKNIPMGAGLGGSSADIAGVLNALSKLYGVDDYAAVKGIADSLGSDSGYMLTGGFARIRGRGEKVEIIESPLKLDLGLIIPSSPVSTKKCFEAYDRLGGGCQTSDRAHEALKRGDAQALGESLSNSLYNAASSINGDVAKAHSALSAFAPLGVNMTGSGSAVYAVFENDQFAQYAKSRSGGKFIITKTIIPSRKYSKWLKRD